MEKSVNDWDSLLKLLASGYVIAATFIVMENIEEVLEGMMMCLF